MIQKWGAYLFLFVLLILFIACNPVQSPTPMSPPLPVAPQRLRLSSLQELRAVTRSPLLVPADVVSPTLTFSSATHEIVQGREAVEIRFTTPAGEVVLQQAVMPAGDHLGAPDEPHEVITLRGVTGYRMALPSTPSQQMVLWEEAGRIIGLSGPLPAATLEQIAENLHEFHRGATSTPPADFTGMELQHLSSASADDAWVAEVLVALPKPGGDLYYTELRIKKTDGSMEWLPISGWNPFGLGYTTPQPVHWSPDGRYLYYTNRPVPDGCGILINAGDLQRFDLRDGSTSEIIPWFTPALAFAPDGSQVAYHAMRGTELRLLDPTTGNYAARQVKMVEEGAQWGAIVWSPDSQKLAFTVAYDPCGPNWRQSIMMMDTQTFAMTTLLEQDPRRMTTTAWPQPDSILITDQDGKRWTLNTTTHAVQEAADQTSSITTLCTPSDRRHCIVSPDGRWVAEVNLARGS